MHIFVAVLLLSNYFQSALTTSPLEPASVSSKFDPNIDCPICTRVISTAQESAKMLSIKPSVALTKFCGMKSRGLEVSDEKFCYDIESVSGTLHRLLDLGASAERCCKRVYQMNPHFCRKKDVDGGRRQLEAQLERTAEATFRSLTETSDKVMTNGGALEPNTKEKAFIDDDRYIAADISPSDAVLNGGVGTVTTDGELNMMHSRGSAVGSAGDGFVDIAVQNSSKPEPEAASKPKVNEKKLSKRSTMGVIYE